MTTKKKVKKKVPVKGTSTPKRPTTRKGREEAPRLRTGEGKPFLHRFAPGMRETMERRQVLLGISTFTAMVNHALREWNDGQPPLPKD